MGEEEAKLEIQLDDFEFDNFELINQKVNSEKEILNAQIVIVNKYQALMEKFLTKLCLLNKMDMKNYSKFTLDLSTKKINFELKEK